MFVHILYLVAVCSFAIAWIARAFFGIHKKHEEFQAKITFAQILIGFFWLVSWVSLLLLFIFFPRENIVFIVLNIIFLFVSLVSFWWLFKSLSRRPDQEGEKTKRVVWSVINFGSFFVLFFLQLLYRFDRI